ncbi:hydroxyethylthiazole kinase [Campylobacter corcagiensis]|uniref:Hydroxyethylthiazole kinase n=1 Tax=Campylobacter corcagiensis TaxID=1448857 RepID=A0A7M1LDD8_9BACT|nr:hydroxyethylthiazole kinase [Campylobacter corcagiensis]QKF65302.1 hydroxyethylthiazole kinase [Campylobacter corcagiensis]QOQ86567.1 hydroxyethylthiazole kinase [Campylobacter corcagiensis]
MFVQNLRAKNPLIHCITNYVTVNDVANAIIACGASPIMADDINEVAEITKISDALVINLGTLNERTVKSMKASLKQANLDDKITVLDPVGASVSKFRSSVAKELLKEFRFSVIKGNLSEIKFLNDLKSSSKGVDISDKDKDESLENIAFIARNLATKTGAIIVITGQTDIISDENTTYICKNGNSMMAEFSGSGCILAGLIAAFVCANKDMPLKAALMAVCCNGVAGDLAKQKNVLTKVGNMTFKQNLIDEIYKMSDDKIEDLAKFEEIE